MPDRALGPDAAAVPIHDLAHAGQADASAGEFAGGMQALEGREELVHVGRVEADAVVADIAGDLAVCDRSHPELDPGVVGAAGELPGVVQQVDQHLADQHAVGQGPGRLLNAKGDAAGRVGLLAFGGDDGHLGGGRSAGG